MKRLMLTNQAIAQGAWQAGVRVVSSYPGTPSTEITECTAKFKEIHSEWAPNEKVALEVGIGASMAGARAMVCMKHVGLNVAADPLFTAAYTGVGGGLVIVVADDPGMHSSQNEQDSRFYARSAHVPMIEPSDSAEAVAFVDWAYRLSEQYDTPVLLRTTTRIAHAQSMVELGERVEVPLKEYQKDAPKYTMLPAHAKGRHLVVEDRENRLKADCLSFPQNRVEMRDAKLGVVCAGAVYQHVREALPNASVFKVGMVYPLPIAAIAEFAQKVDELLVVEELEPFIENQLKANGIACHGKDLFGLQGEITVAHILNKVLGKALPTAAKVPGRPPLLCAGCPHRGVYYVLRKLHCVVNGDIGCYTLGALPPLSAVDSVVCMGASIGMAHGFKYARPDAKNVAVIGDSTFVHSGVTGLINAVYNHSGITLVILDNRTTGMTGHQDHPATGKTCMGDPAPQLDLEALCLACGVAKVDVVDPYDMAACEAVLRDALADSRERVVIARRACIMKERVLDAKPLSVSDCRGCGKCLGLGCPAIVKSEGKAVIDRTQCVGCKLCKDVCPFGCIGE